MQRITLLCVGRLKTKWVAEACTDYAERVGRFAKFALRDLPASKANVPQKQREEESQSLQKIIANIDGDVWLLDEKGEQMTSNEFSLVLSQAKDAGRSLTFLLGGAYGLTPETKRIAKRSLRLSAMTLPHELCRVVFLEQLYRGFEIAKGSGYHH